MKHKKVKNINYKLFLISLERKSARSSPYEAANAVKMLKPCDMKRPNFGGETRLFLPSGMFVIDEFMIVRITYLCSLKPRI